MTMKRAIVLVAVFTLLLAGCAQKQESDIETVAPADNLIFDVVASNETQQSETAHTVIPLPDMTIENLDDSIVAISLEAGDAYVDENGTMQMAVTVYSYDKYDMVDIANLNVGDIIVRFSGEVNVTSKEQDEAGTIYINGGLENGGFNLVTDEDGVFYEMGYNDSKNWYEVEKVTLPISADFIGVDNADLEHRDLVLTPDSFLNDQIIIFDFTPYNTTIRIEGGQIVELNRRYIP